MSKIIVIPGHTSVAVLVALVERERGAPIVALEGEWKECWECGTEYHITDQCHVCHPIQSLEGETVECFECGALMAKFSTCPVSNPDCRHE